MGLITHKVKQYDDRTYSTYHYVTDFTAFGALLVIAFVVFLWYFGESILEAIISALTSAVFSLIVLVILRRALRVMSEGTKQLVPCVRPDGTKLFPWAARVQNALLFGKRRPTLLYLISFVLCFIGAFLSFQG